MQSYIRNMYIYIYKPLCHLFWIRSTFFQSKKWFIPIVRNIIKYEAYCVCKRKHGDQVAFQCKVWGSTTIYPEKQCRAPKTFSIHHQKQQECKPKSKGFPQSQVIDLTESSNLSGLACFHVYKCVYIYIYVYTCW